MPGGGDWRYLNNNARQSGNVKESVLVTREEFNQLRNEFLQAGQAPAGSPGANNSQVGSYRLNTNVSDQQAEQMGARVTREQFERYMNQYAPVERELAGSIGSNSAQQAARNSTADAQRARASLERMRERYGTSLTAGQQGAESRQFTNQTRLGQLSATNSARQLDEDRDFNLRGTLLNIGNNLSSSAMGGLTESANNATARNNAHQAALADHKAAKSQQKAQTVSTVASIAAIGAIAF